MRSLRDKLLKVFDLLLEAYGEQRWWPVDKDYHKIEGSDPREEIVIGAVLTQNTSWKNVEKALENLKRERSLSLKKIKGMSLEKLEKLIRPTGYYRQKAVYLKEVAKRLDPVSKVESVSREELLGIKGVGRETADAILLYAGGRPYFVIDTYTKRIVKRILDVEGNYEELRKLFEDNLPRDVELYKEFHALLDEHAKRFCRKAPSCEGCPLIQVCTQPSR